MTRDAQFNRVVQRHARDTGPRDTGQRYTEAPAHLMGLEERMFHEPVGDRLLAHLTARYGIDAVAATTVSQHNLHVFRIDRGDGDPWIARVFPPARPRAGAEGDAAILRCLARQGYPAERLASDDIRDSVSEFDGSSVLLTRHIDGRLLPSPAVGAEGAKKMAIMGDLLGRLHALTPDGSVTRPGGASGEDPLREGSPRQDLLAAQDLLDAVDTLVGAPARERFDQLRHQVLAGDDGAGLPVALVHGNLLHAPDHVVVGVDGPAAIQWKSAGLGPRLADLAYLMWGTWLNAEWIGAAADAYRRHVEPTAAELDRLQGVMAVRPLYLACFDWWRALTGGHQPSPADPWWGEPDPAYLDAAATAVRSAFSR